MPYAREIMDSFNENPVTVVMSASQVAKTEILNNVIGYFIHLDPCPMLVIQPTLEMGEAWSKDRLAPMVRDTEVLSELIDLRSRNSGNNILYKQFPAGQVTIAGANSPASLASRPVRILVGDETDRFPKSAGQEGSPEYLAYIRTSNFWNRRVGWFSTPTIKGASTIESLFEQSDKRRYFLPCPHCNHKQFLVWGQVTWEKGKPGEAWYKCENCEKKIPNSVKPWMLAKGEWRATAPYNGIAGFHLPGLCSPWLSFGQIATEFLQAKDDRQKLMVWTNTRLGESYDTQGGEGLEWQQLLARCEPYAPLSVPAGGLLLTAGVDVQGDRLAVSVWAWGIGEEAWLVYHCELYGDPSEAKVWDDLDALLLTKFTHESGAELGITAAAIDTGFKANDVYNFVRTRAGRNIYAVKGQSTAGKPAIGKPSFQEVTWKGKTLKKGVRLWPVGSDTVKGVIYSRLRITRHGPGHFHFPIGTDEEYFEQLTAEKLVPRYIKGFLHQEWVKARPRNEALDCAVYAYAAAVALGIQRMDWVKLKAVIAPEVVTEAEEPAPEPKPTSRRQRTRSRDDENFATDW